ncbi:MAG: hypothetical protein JWP65_169 [Ramlibacter sp.]|jgi:uncharacterized protein YndB with AHSA1/START domain|uniref:SRPBCC family protein n=1 Tax=Ramlibacter sp. TaxID=1917967 RepID=UPI00260930C1|nr:SRPBCC domain-containing protein [Ramlibacter sp.]MDB5749748.1 hypothetical protein [Ramlibacter sp.]
MSSAVTVRVSHRYCAPAEKVFDAWLTPAQASRFLFRTRTGNVMQCQIQPSVGGGFTVTDRRPAADGDESVFDVVHLGKFVAIERPHRLMFDLSVLNMGADESTRVTVEVKPLNAATCEVTISQELGAGRDAHFHQEPSRKGWTSMLQTIERELFPRRVGVQL